MDINRAKHAGFDANNARFDANNAVFDAGFDLLPRILLTTPYLSMII